MPKRLERSRGRRSNRQLAVGRGSRRRRAAGGLAAAMFRRSTSERAPVGLPRMCCRSVASDML
eukprot:9171330-Pyramimonas_sp.AAC.1